MLLNIDGVAYGGLRQIHARAARILHPSRFEPIHVPFGLEDAHGVNIMIEDRAQSNSVRRNLYVEYEVSAHHSPIVKPLYSDVFSGVLYADCIPEPPRVDVSITRGRLTLRLHSASRRLSQGIFEIKRRHLIEPLLLHAPELGLDSIEVLSNCLFASALLTRNFSEHTQAFFISLCHAVKLNQNVIRSLGNVQEAVRSVI